MRRAGEEGRASKALVPALAEEDAVATEECHCDGERLESEVVRAEVREGDGLLRLRKAAQRICDGFVGTGALGGAAHATAFFSACNKDGEEPSYCCRGTDSREFADRKKRAPEGLERKDVELYAHVNSEYRSLQRALEDANIDGTAPDSLGEAAVLLAEQRELVERREAQCRADMDNLKDCGDPLLFFLDLRHLYTDLGTAVDRVAEAANACTSPRKRVLGAVTRGGRMVTRRSTGLVSRVAHYGRRVIALTWRNRIRLMAGMVIAKGAQPFIQELVDAGMDEVLATSMADAFANIVVAMKAISCQVVQEPLLMAELVTLSTRFVGNVLVAATPEEQRDLGETLEGFMERSEKGLLSSLRSVPQAFVTQARDFGQTLASNAVVPVVSELLVVFASEFFQDLADAICTALGESAGAGGAVASMKEASKPARVGRTKSRGRSSKKVGKELEVKPPKPVKPAKTATKPEKAVAKPAKPSKPMKPAKPAKTAKSTTPATPAKMKAAPKPEKVVVPAKAAKVASTTAVPRGGANALATGALGGIFTGMGFMTVGREGAHEVVAWSEMAGSHPVPVGQAAEKPRRRRGKRDRLPPSLAEVGAIAGGAALLEGGSRDWNQEAAASMMAMGDRLLEMAQNMPRTPEMKELEGALTNAKTSMPMFSLLAWSAEHVLALLSGSDSDFDQCEPSSKRCMVPTLRELKLKSKDVLTEIERLSDNVLRNCSTGEAKMKAE